MSEELAALLDLELAWRRVRHDLHDRVFITYPHERELIEADLPGWLGYVADLVQRDAYNPSPITIAEVPKGGGLVRPGSHLALVDHLIYTACVGACLPQIREALSWSQGSVDFGYRLAEGAHEVAWVRDRFTGWTEFRRESLERVQDESTTHVLISDIAAFYESLNLALIVSDLRSLNAPEPAVAQISACLNRWAQAAGRGIPQGTNASDILAKLYLNNVDLNLRSEDYHHLRYVDDMRVFCGSRTQARRALVALVQRLRQRGLHVQSAKTKVLSVPDATRFLRRPLQTLLDVGRRFVAELRETIGDDNPYVNLRKIDATLSGDPENAPIEIFEEAYQLNFGDPDSPTFDALFFHYLMKRFAVLKSPFPFQSRVVDHLVSHPEETNTIINYLNAIPPEAAVEESVCAFIESEDAIYPYQIYQLLTWLGSRDLPPGARAVGLARRLAFDRRQPQFVRLVGRKILGDYGSSADLERLESEYSPSMSPLEQAEVICCLRRMERNRRNGFMARAEGDGELQRRAVALVRRRGRS